MDVHMYLSTERSPARVRGQVPVSRGQRGREREKERKRERQVPVYAPACTRHSIFLTSCMLACAHRRAHSNGHLGSHGVAPENARRTAAQEGRSATATRPRTCSNAQRRPRQRDSSQGGQVLVKPVIL